MLLPVIDAVELAATLCRRVQPGHIPHSEKAGSEPVTIADYGSQAILCRAISLAYPDDAILAEEQTTNFLNGTPEVQRAHVVQLVSETLGLSVSEGDIAGWLDYGRDRTSVRRWTIDPIDGTKGFLALRRYTIAVGLIVNNQPVDAVMG